MTGSDTAERVDVPSAFVALTVNVYEVDDVNPAIVSVKSVQVRTFTTSPLLLKLVYWATGDSVVIAGPDASARDTLS